jgi:CheY-like chemotaxis protein
MLPLRHGDSYYIGRLLNGAYQIVYARNGAEGLEIAAEQMPDLILTDLMMPEMDGYEATRKIRAADQSWNKIPVIAQTANAMKDDLDLCMAAGMNDYITKPINYDVMQEVLQRWVSNRQSKGVS